ncbi:MAG: ferredoxin--NADP reductase [Gammaproteobacteria bacterium]|nr:ferredoxin--NADP reductase [Gammaproteobacteria bacterium]NIR98894.1 ferredoxin--NADP reductase [Gammaproteobacteria bacterium]NIT64015.1 ferredoxin--NADP reductase [Gammaproteobacteria bacterium]NIV19175.1 ferredoxin--NADP(+) reductase [Gammaproteobacteria bacterium]NIX10344.1 ferredoxin--NADP(+) reductase [Gammaproteobacteria bacterium]
MSKWVEGQVVAKRYWTGQLVSLQVEAAVAPFRAGQFTKLGLDLEGERIERPYSYVNPPHQGPLEFYFITVPDGPLTNAMAALDRGDGLWVQAQPSGLFTLADVPDGEDLWLLATGTALGVFLSILQTEEPWERFANVVLVHGVRTVEELTYRRTLEELAYRRGRQFRMVPFVSREETELGFQGRLTHALTDGRLERHTGLEIAPGRSQVMICGNRDMVRDATSLLTERELKKNRRSSPGHITTEHYF